MEKLERRYRNRLNRLADKLEGKGAYEEIGPVPAHKFDMANVWSECKGGGHIEQEDFNPRRCNTAACGIGWAVSDPWFRKRGLRDDNPFFWGPVNYFGLFLASNYDEGRHVKASVVAACLRRAAKHNI